MLFSAGVFAEEWSDAKIKTFFCDLEKYEKCIPDVDCSNEQLKSYSIVLMDYYYPSDYWRNAFLKELNNSNFRKKRWVFDVNLIMYKYQLLSWFKKETSISIFNQINIFDQNECGVNSYNSYVSRPLPEDADFVECLQYYHFDNQQCVPNPSKTK